MLSAIQVSVDLIMIFKRFCVYYSSEKYIFLYEQFEKVKL